jgi:hypothetical protein
MLLANGADEFDLRCHADADATAETKTGAHTGGAGRNDTCEGHWGGDYDFGDPQQWCCDSWCYVDPTKCTKEVADALGITVAQSWTKTDVYYRYIYVHMHHRDMCSWTKNDV